MKQAGLEGKQNLTHIKGRGERMTLEGKNEGRCGQDVLSNRQLWSTNIPFPRHPSCGYIRPVP